MGASGISGVFSVDARRDEDGRQLGETPTSLPCLLYTKVIVHLPL